MKEKIEHEFAFYIAIWDFSVIRKLKTRCDCTNIIEISGILEIEELIFIESIVLRITDKFGDIDISFAESQLKNLLLKSDINENK
ncbi:MAG: hypothetical protein JXA38_03190 [Methanosarcinaceae archaeon]|nr:hypothetical protein [Methanosarcinaceae archaeon]